MLNIFGSIKNCNGNVLYKNASYTQERGRKAVFSLLQKARSLGNLTPAVYFTLFNALVQPILLYGSDVWGAKPLKNNKDKVSLEFIKLILGVKPNTCTIMVYGESGRYPIDIDAQCNAIKFYVRLHTMSPNSIVKQVFNQLVRLHELGFHTWVTDIHDLLNEYDIHIDENNLDSLASLYKKKAYAAFVENWESNLKSECFPILYTYKLLKTDFKMEPYLYLKNDRARKALSKIRTSSHSLEIERGRHSKPKTDRNLRICKLCNSNQVEDEYHFIMQCSLYNDLREELFSKLCTIDKTFPDLQMHNRFIYLFCNGNPQIQCWFGKYVHNCFTVRSSHN